MEKRNKKRQLLRRLMMVMMSLCTEDYFLWSQVFSCLLVLSPSKRTTEQSQISLYDFSFISRRSLSPARLVFTFFSEESSGTLLVKKKKGKIPLSMLLRHVGE